MTELRRSLGLTDATALVVGCVIGVGIFRSAASVARYLTTPGSVMLVWVLGGIISFCGALCYAELGAAYPKTGGDYVYLTRAYGPAVGFLFGWTKIFTERVGTIAILGFVFAEYMSYLIEATPLAVRLAASFAILLLTGANIVGVHVGKGVQNFLTLLKVLSLGGIIAVGFFGRGGDSPSLIQSAASWQSDLGMWRSLGVALVFVLWTYGGWTESSYVAEEIRDPHRTLPWSILWGLALVTGLYLLVNWVYLLYIPLDQMPQKQLVAAEVMKIALGPLGGKVTALMVALSAFGALNGYILTSGRIALALGRDHALFAKLSHVHPVFATPARALAFNALAALLLVWTGTFDQIVTYSTVAISIFFAMAAFGVMILRARDPQTPRPYRVWGYPLTPLIFLLAMVLFIANITLLQPKETWLGFALMALGLPLYLWSGSLRKRAALIAALAFFLAQSGSALSEEFSQQREAMVSRQIQGRGVQDPRVLAAMRKVPRHLFVPEPLRGLAYGDSPLPIGEGQTISQPYIVALMTELCEISAGEKVLEIGTGSGYQAAVLAELTDRVFTIEILPGLAASAAAVFKKLGTLGVKTKVGDGYLGWPEEAPFDAVLVTAAPEEIPRPLVDQLNDGGVLVIPVGPAGGAQELRRLRKKGGRLLEEKIIPVAFVPLIRQGEGVE
ncbi:MAG: protein-L-isoaspartate(D-aspartate) O-methyltransferase [Candidatus Omnitrophica bacterium]|nr:protein-L-isoaspartate(D-aspartate) O-methyltransferase [Candidatus Omnitrophota bacterium]